jgi:hypothetical protein
LNFSLLLSQATRRDCRFKAQLFTFVPEGLHLDR